ncbi:hypothetical protein ACFL2T_01945 [Elusimicrobiota bacterium]
MTRAVCLKCGEFKIGAWSPCRKCGFSPEDEESITRHKLATDHFFSPKELEAISERVKAGEEVQFPPELFEIHRAGPADMAQLDRKMKVGCLVVLTLVVFAAVLLVLKWLGILSSPFS